MPDQSSFYNHTIQAVIIFVDTTTKNTMLQFNFLRYDRYGVGANPFGTATIGIDTSIYGTDFNKKCIIGLPRILTFKYSKPIYMFTLDPSVGTIDGIQKSYNNEI